jgi:S-DNA-T family DNA segregation ATPase FtsK/SpoIIIE
VSNDSSGPPTFHRSPRDYPALPTQSFNLQPPPPPPSEPSTSVSTFIVPIAGTIAGLAMATFGLSGDNALYVVLGIPVVLVSYLATAASYIHERERFRKATAERLRAYGTYLQQQRTALDSARTTQHAATLLPNPDPRDAVERSVTHDRRLWERAPEDADFLQLRLGIGDVAACYQLQTPASTQITVEPDPLTTRMEALAREFRTVSDCAITLPFAGLGAVGFAGERDAVQESLRALLIQLAVNHAPSEVKLVVIAPETEADAWLWTRWLPHTWSDDRGRRYVAADAASAARLLEELGETLSGRAAPGNASAAAPGPTYVVLFADPGLPRQAAAAPLLRQLLTNGHRIGAVSLFTGDRIEAMPKGCQAVVDLTGAGGRIRVVGPPRLDLAFQPDRLDLALAERCARALAPLRLQGIGGAATIPRYVTLLDMLGVHAVEELPLLANWERSKPDQTLAAPIGIGPGGAPIELDFHERGHGPHGLEAGMTGSGKSELLQTLIASLAVFYHPREVAFVLIDYKGGGMAGAFQELPHHLGTITNLGGNLTIRALAALRAELQRRQRLFAEAGVNRLDRYLQLQRAGKVSVPLPHLIIIADEFAELRQNQPEFMAELISAVRIGRSLGIHLLLATQKPSGVVTDQIWANSNFRLCLRVQSPQDSKEMIKRPDAAAIPGEHRGRAICKWAWTRFSRCSKPPTPAPPTSRRTRATRPRKGSSRSG